MSDTADTKPRPTKSELVIKLLSRKAGADMGALREVTGWQPHSVRAVLSGLRKAGYTLDRQPAKTENGGPIYRIAARPEAKA